MNRVTSYARSRFLKSIVFVFFAFKACLISTFRVAESMGFKGDFRQWEELLRIGDENCCSLFVTAEQCKSDRTLKERRKRTGKLARLFLFGKPDFPAKT